MKKPVFAPADEVGSVGDSVEKILIDTDSLEFGFLEEFAGKVSEEQLDEFILSVKGYLRNPLDMILIESVFRDRVSYYLHFMDNFSTGCDHENQRIWEDVVNGVQNSYQALYEENIKTVIGIEGINTRENYLRTLRELGDFTEGKTYSKNNLSAAVYIASGLHPQILNHILKICDINDLETFVEIFINSYGLGNFTQQENVEKYFYFIKNLNITDRKKYCEVFNGREYYPAVVFELDIEILKYFFDKFDIRDVENLRSSFPKSLIIILHKFKDKESLEMLEKIIEIYEITSIKQLAELRLSREIFPNSMGHSGKPVFPLLVPIFAIDSIESLEQANQDEIFLKLSNCASYARLEFFIERFGITSQGQLSKLCNNKILYRFILNHFIGTNSDTIKLLDELFNMYDIGSVEDFEKSDLVNQGVRIGTSIFDDIIGWEHLGFILLLMKLYSKKRFGDLKNDYFRGILKAFKQSEISIDELKAMNIQTPEELEEILEIV